MLTYQTSHLFCFKVDVWSTWTYIDKKYNPLLTPPPPGRLKKNSPNCCWEKRSRLIKLKFYMFSIRILFYFKLTSTEQCQFFFFTCWIIHLFSQTHINKHSIVQDINIFTYIIQTAWISRAGSYCFWKTEFIDVSYNIQE